MLLIFQFFKKAVRFQAQGIKTVNEEVAIAAAANVRFEFVGPDSTWSWASPGRVPVEEPMSKNSMVIVRELLLLPTTPFVF